MRQAQVERQTKETQIRLSLNLDGSGKVSIHTGIGFFDHMLSQIMHHGQMDLELEVTGDLDVDSHHTIEDTGLALGQALAEALGDKAGITRYGTAYVPMDESLARTVLDLSGRPYIAFKAEMPYAMLGDYPTEMTREFFTAVAMKAGLTLHMEVLYGVNLHHQTEALYKAFGRALKQAIYQDPERSGIPSTKGIL